MARAYITPNWHAINKAIASPADKWAPIRELEALKKLIREKIDASDKASREAQRQANRKAIRALNVGDPIKYVGSDTFREVQGRLVAYGFAGANGTITRKPSPTLKWISVDFGPVGKWRIHIDNLNPGQHEPQVAEQHQEQARTQGRIGTMMSRSGLL